MTALILCGILATKDAWAIKSQLAPASKITWNVSGVGTIGGQDHDAVCDIVEAAIGDPNAKGQPVKVSMENLIVDGNPTDGEELTGTATLANLISAPAEKLYLQKMFSLFDFVYPPGPVSVGDKWNAKQTSTELSGGAKSSLKWSGSYTVIKIDKVDGADALQIDATVKEDGDSGLDATESWWLDKTGKILKFKLESTNWTLVTQGATVKCDKGTFTGKLKP